MSIPPTCRRILTTLAAPLAIAGLGSGRALAATAPDDDAAAQAHGREQLEALVAPMLAGSGVWRAPNRDHAPGDPATATYWRLEHEWLFGRTLMRYRILGEMESGETTKYWEGTVVWDPRAEVARVQQVHRAGILGLGDLRRVDDRTVRFSVTFWRPGGGAEIYRDDMTMTGPDTMESRSYGYDAGEWVWRERNVEHWTLVPGAGEAAAATGAGGD